MTTVWTWHLADVLLVRVAGTHAPRMAHMAVKDPLPFSILSAHRMFVFTSRYLSIPYTPKDERA